MDLSDKLRRLECLGHPTKNLTEDQLSAIKSLKSYTTLSDEATDSKLDYIVQTSKILKKEPALKNEWALYLAAAVDIELPLLMGFRKITLLDPEYKLGEGIKEISEKVSRYSGNFDREALKGTLRFDFGEGPENVEIQLIPMGMRDYQPEREYGFMFEVLGPEQTIFFQNYVFEKTRLGGYIMKHLNESLPNPGDYGLAECPIDGSVKFYKKVSNDVEHWHNFGSKVIERDTNRQSREMFHHDLDSLDFEVIPIGRFGKILNSLGVYQGISRIARKLGIEKYIPS